MNRLVIIGNGFDLAHGLPTMYRDFINDYVNSLIEELKKNYKYEDVFFKINLGVKDPLNPFDRRSIYSLNSIEDVREFVLDLGKLNRLPVNLAIFDIKNNFFYKLCNKNNIQNWVDIEKLYYDELIETLKPSVFPKFNGLGVNTSKENIIFDLNKDFEQVKILLEKYLKEKVDEVYSLDSNPDNAFKELIKDGHELDGRELNRFYQELSFIESIELNNQLLESPNPENLKGPILKITNYFLTFNYTNVLLNYFKSLGINELHINHLHGRLNDLSNPINFGFGDEKDKMYKKIEEKNDNEYLKNIKSFKYLNNPNYKNLLDYIDSKKFQVYIMGHSCGLSDRTLLNTIFEHVNCRSIKVFYHEKKDKNGKVIKDNYTEIIQNISRHFNDKKLMRSKIVNKTLCQPLPQIQLPKKP
jgi:hypothetical protein